MKSRLLITTLSDASATDAIRDPRRFLNSIAHALDSAVAPRDDWLAASLAGPTKGNHRTGPGSRFFRPGTRVNKAGVTVETPNSWWALHQLLQRIELSNNWPIGFLVHGGATLSDGDQSVRVLTSAEVREVGARLLKLTRKKLSQHFDATTSRKLTPDLQPVDDNQLCEHLLDLFDILRRFFAEASENELAVYILED